MVGANGLDRAAERPGAARSAAPSEARGEPRYPAANYLDPKGRWESPFAPSGLKMKSPALRGFSDTDGRREWTRTIDPHHVKVVL